MADTSIFNLTATATLNDADVVPVVDVSDVAQSVNGSTRKTLLSTLAAFLAARTTTLTNKTINLASNTVTGTLAEFNTAVSDANLASLAGAEALTNKTVNLANNTVTGTTAEFNTALSDGSFATLAGTEALTNKTIDGANNTLTVRIANDVSGLVAGVATFLATPSSANLASAVTGETGSGALVFGTSPTIATPTITGVYTAAGAPILSANAMAALEIDTAVAVNTKSIAADSTFTFSAAPATDTWFGLSVTNTDTNPHVLTIPSSYSFSLQTAITTLVIGASSRLFLQWRRTASGYELLGDTNYLNNYTATAAPAVTDDVSDGYGPGSFWLNATGNDTYICESNGAGAAVWHQLNGGGGTVSISGTPSAGQAAEWTSAAAIQGVAVTGTGSYVKATSPTLVTPALGTPASGTLTNCTGLPAAGLVNGAAQSWGISATLIGSVADGDIVLYMKVPAALNGATITETVSDCTSGTATATFKINTTALGGTANSVSSTEQSQAHAATNTLATGDDIVVTISSASSLLDPRFSLSGLRSLT